MRFGLEQTDGGRGTSGIPGKAQDCVTRAIAIATDCDYLTVRDLLNDFCKSSAECWKYQRRRFPYTDHGIFPSTHTTFLKALGWCYRPIRSWGDVPTQGTFILHVTRHLVTVRNGIVLDTWDSRRKHVKGYYFKS